MRRGLARMLASTALTFMVLGGCDSVQENRFGVDPVLTPQQSGISTRLQAISAVDENVVWVSGLGGSFAHTTDGGETWTAGIVMDADSMQFRDVDAFDKDTAYLLSAGSGDRSRIYKTTDGGQHWVLQFTNDEPAGFFDCMAFWDSKNGVAFSDAVDGEFIIVRTSDGETWDRVPAERVPDALPGEGSFAASGTCLITYGDSTAWFGTGASDTARVFKTTNRGRTWSAYSTPIVSDSMSGITSLSFVDHNHGFAAGGNIGHPVEYSDNAAYTNDGGMTWDLAGRPTYPGAIYGTSSVPGTANPLLVAVGPAGADYSVDWGMTWQLLDTLDYWSVAFASPSAGWAVGPDGRIAKISF